MRHGKMTREDAVKLVGKEAVEKLDKENCDFTNRLQTDGDDSVEFSASIQCKDMDGEDVTLVAYYYQDEDDIAEEEDLGNLDWEIEGYEII